jgi:hypothetical protein
LIRGFPNGATRQGNTLPSRSEFIAPTKRTGGSEPSQYPQEEKTIVIPSVAASERGRAQTGQVQACKRCLAGVVGRFWDRLQPVRGVRNHQFSRRFLERTAGEGDSPVSERLVTPWRCSRVPRDTRNPVGSWVDHDPRLNTTLRPIVNQYREGKVKSTPVRGVK